MLLVLIVPSASSFWHYQEVNNCFLALMSAPQLPQKEPKGLGKFNCSAEFARPAHNSLYYWWVDTLGLLSFLEFAVCIINSLMDLDRTRDMRGY